VDRATGTLLDGWHRLAVLKEAGFEEIPVLFEDCPPQRHFLRALELNTRHGAPLSIEERNRALRTLAQQGLPQAEIARAARLSQQRVSQILATSKWDRFDERDQPIFDEALRPIFDAALRLVDQGRSIRDAAAVTRIPRSTLERIVLKEKARQALISRHHQSRHGLLSLLRYPDRGPWGKASYFGNCTGYFVVDLIDHCHPASVLDPMQGSGTTGEVCRDLRVDYVGGDLQSGVDLLTSPLPDRTFDLIFLHPPYFPGHPYSDHPHDFSRAKNVDEYVRWMKAGVLRLRDLLAPGGHLVILIGDGRKDGVFYPVHSTILEWNLLPLEAILIKEGDHERRSQHYRYGPTPFIPTVHEYVLLFKAGGSR
jgi:transposase-like protein